ncbi:MAG: DNA polymerase subunit beta [Thermofilum sp. ex4484_82]|nr:MAG: DNA polymerase subunit beta [Thermofilum sp. ex4484_82]OYT37748.1 MAG: DNA polymerase subunit beta [Archaeoglobales archaeon ex4484_92]RLE73964.1 MAG: nucleotidyltransferase domain-containing protein [Thermoprotei archaeon]
MQKKLSSGLRRKLLKSRARKIREGDKLLREYVEKISRKYPKSTIILFGSRARGDYLPYSDYDLVVVLQEVDDKISTIEEFRRLKPRGLPLDLLVIRVDELSDPLILKMFRKCKILYNGLKINSKILNRQV